MDHATRRRGLAFGAGSILSYAAHGGLFAAGFAALAIFVPTVLEQPPVTFRDTGAITAAANVPSAEAVSPARAEVAAASPALPAAVAPRSTLSVEMRRVRDYVAERYRVSSVALEPVLAAAEAAGRKVGIDPLLIVAVMAVESRFNPFAESHMGAQGLMQIIPRYHKDKIGADAGEDALFDPQLNVHVGVMVLKDGLQRFGEMEAALQYYAGALNDPQAGYAQKVFAIKERLTSAARRGTPTGSTGA